MILMAVSPCRQVSPNEPEPRRETGPPSAAATSASVNRGTCTTCHLYDADCGTESPPGAVRPASARAGWNSKETPPANYILVIIRVTGVTSASDRQYGTDETSANRVSVGSVRSPAKGPAHGIATSAH